jgi:hypothetical protein
MKRLRLSERELTSIIVALAFWTLVVGVILTDVTR